MNTVCHKNLDISELISIQKRMSPKGDIRSRIIGVGGGLSSSGLRHLSIPPLNSSLCSNMQHGKYKRSSKNIAAFSKVWETQRPPEKRAVTWGVVVLLGKYRSLSGTQWIPPSTKGAQKVLWKDGCAVSQYSRFRMWSRKQDAINPHIYQSKQ